jgi:hypothetical protein
MNCQQFQEILPFIIESGGSEEDEAHLKTCPSCAALVQDLRYIAEQAKLLLPMHDPNPRVWNNIEQSLQQEGLLSEGRRPGQGQLKKNSTPHETKSWTSLGWAMAIAAVALFSVVLIRYKPKQLPSTLAQAQNVSADSAQLNNDDRELLTQLSQDSPDAGLAYASNLREVNAYISDAQQAVQRDPEDATAQELLQDAYQQKEMLYQMATARSLP